MHNRTRIIAAAATVSVALAAGSAAAIASTTGAKPTAPATAKSAEERQGHAAITAAVAQALHVSAARVSAALQPLFAAGHAEASSPVVAAAARALGVSTQQLNAALVHAKLSLVGTYARQGAGGAKPTAPATAKSAEERQGHAAITAAVAQALHVSAARVSAALQPLFAAGHAEASSPVVAAAARALGVSTQQLNAALVHAKLSLAPGS